MDYIIESLNPNPNPNLNLNFKVWRPLIYNQTEQLDQDSSLSITTDFSISSSYNNQSTNV